MNEIWTILNNSTCDKSSEEQLASYDFVNDIVQPIMIDFCRITYFRNEDHVRVIKSILKKNGDMDKLMLI